MKQVLRIRDALIQGMREHPYQTIGGWYGGGDKTIWGEECPRLPGACVMGTIFRGAESALHLGGIGGKGWRQADPGWWGDFGRKAWEAEFEKQEEATRKELEGMLSGSLAPERRTAVHQRLRKMAATHEFSREEYVESRRALSGHENLQAMFPFLSEPPRYPVAYHDENGDAVVLPVGHLEGRNLLDAAIHLNDAYKLQRDEITAWLERHEQEWIEANTDQATYMQLASAEEKAEDAGRVALDDLRAAIDKRLSPAQIERSKVQVPG